MHAYVQAYVCLPYAWIPMPMFIFPYDLPPCPHNNNSKNKIYFLLIKSSNFVLLHMPCYHLRFMHATSPYFPPPCLPFALVVTHFFTFVSSSLHHVFIMEKDFGHVALLLLKNQLDMCPFFIEFHHLVICCIQISNHHVVPTRAPYNI